MFMFVYVMQTKLGKFAHMVEGENYHDLLETHRLVMSGAQVKDLLYVGPICAQGREGWIREMPA